MRERFRTPVAAASLGVAVLLSAAQPAAAGAFGVRNQSAYGIGSAFAGSAAPGDSISALFWNPAAVTTADGLEVESDHTLGSPHAAVDLDSGTSTLLGSLGDGGDLGVDGYLPSGYVAYQVDGSVYLGLSVTAPYGLSSHAEAPWAGAFDSLSARTRSVDVSPVVGYRLNEAWSIGLGADVQWLGVDLTRATGLFPLTTAELSGDGVGFGVTGGVTYTPAEGTVIGLGYRSGVHHDLDGLLTTSTASLPVTASMTLPESVSLGVRQAVTDRLTLLGGAEWQNWSRLGTVAVTTTSGATATELPFEYDDGWYFSIGAEYALTDRFTVRSGVGYEISPVQDAYRSARLPDANSVHVAAGLSYAVTDSLAVDLGYEHLFLEAAPLSYTVSGLTYSGTSEGSADIVSLALRYTFGD